MNEAEFRTLSAIDRDHWWFVGKRLLLRVLLGEPSGTHLLDLGCGTGGVLSEWYQQMVCVGVDASPEALRICAGRGLCRLVRADVERPLPLKADSFDVVLLLDVLEHVDDDAGLLRAAVSVCRPGGRVVIAVPAWRLLWSQHDVTFGHKRRYRPREIAALMRAANLTLDRITCTNTLVFPLALAWRVIGFRLGLVPRSLRHDFVRLPRWLNALLTGIYRCEAWLLSVADLPVGVSIVGIGHRPPPPPAPTGSALRGGGESPVA